MTFTNTSASDQCLEGRVKPRTNLFVSAALISDEGCHAVKVRNLSESGAQVEGLSLPSPGTGIRLSRGSQTVPGRVVWKKEGRAGLHFDALITVQDWLPGLRKQHQSAVDEHIHHIRMGATASVQESALQPESEPGDVDQEATKIAQLLEDVATALAHDPIVVAHHAWKLQQLDLAIQKLHRLRRK